MIKILPIHHVVPLVFLMPKWNSLYCISLGGWRMLVIESSQKSLVLFLQSVCSSLWCFMGASRAASHPGMCRAVLCSYPWQLLTPARNLFYLDCFVWDSRLKACSTSFKTHPVWKSCALLASCAFWLALKVQRDPNALLIPILANRKQDCILILFLMLRMQTPHVFSGSQWDVEFCSLLQMLLVKQLLRKLLEAMNWGTFLRRREWYHSSCNLHLPGLLFSWLHLFI